MMANMEIATLRVRAWPAAPRRCRLRRPPCPRRARSTRSRSVVQLPHTAPRVAG
jgi:hypothetical protein